MSTKLHIGRSKIFIIFLVSFLFGVLVASFVNVFVTKWYFIFLSGSIILSYFFKNKKCLYVFIWVFGLVFGMWYINFYASQRIYNLPYNKEINVIGKVVDEPDVRENKTKLIVKIEEVLDDKANISKHLIEKRILVDTCRYPEFNYQDKIKITGLLEAPDKINDFDYGVYLRLDDVGAIMQTCQSFSKQTSIELLSHGKQYTDVYYLIFKVKKTLIDKLNSIYPEPVAGLLNGILFGTKKAIGKNLSEQLNIAGLTHIVVVSGYHVVILTQIFIILTRSWPKKMSFIAGTIFLVMFSIFVGMGASVIRSVIMAWLMLFAKVVGRKANITNIIIVTCAAMVIENPLIVKDDVGFQLSFLSFVGVAYVGPIIIKYFKKVQPMLSEIISSTLGAQIMTTPLIIVYFKRLSLVAPLTNILIVPVVPLSMLGGFVSVVFGLIHINIGFIVSWPTRILMNYMLFIVEKFSNFSLAARQIDINGWYYLVLYYLIVFIVLKIITKRSQ